MDRIILIIDRSRRTILGCCCPSPKSPDTNNLFHVHLGLKMQVSLTCFCHLTVLLQAFLKPELTKVNKRKSPEELKEYDVSFESFKIYGFFRIFDSNILHKIPLENNSPPLLKKKRKEKKEHHKTDVFGQFWI